MHRARSTLAALLPLALLPVLAVLGALRSPAAGTTSPGDAGDAPSIDCDCELRSWIVAGRARHLLLEIDCPAGAEELDGVVEFTSAAQREEYDPTRDGARTPRIARMTRGVRLRPALPRAEIEERVEARWTISTETARCLQRDRLFEHGYLLLGPNSNSAMRAALESCGLDLPGRVAVSAGLLGEFPGVDFDPGDEIPHERWDAFGVEFSHE